MSKQPMQPVYTDENGVYRFRENSLVRYILDHGKIDLNHLAVVDFPQEDREQFAQLIGYSLSGYSELSYVSDESHGTALTMIQSGKDEKDARIECLENLLNGIREVVKQASHILSQTYPNDLES